MSENAPPVRTTFPTQKATLEWVKARWPHHATPIWRAGKLNEEAGEVIGAVIKREEGRKTDADVRQEVSQVVICAMALAEAEGFDLWDAVAEEYERATR
jgi:NTP pyrophosphatase (non-canonical NTP hydrolase)